MDDRKWPKADDMCDRYECLLVKVKQTGTIHWEYNSVFKETFPNLGVTQNLVEPDGRCMTSAGGTAPLDLMLHYIRSEHGEIVTGAIADLAIHHGQRACDIHQRLSLKERLGIQQPTLLRAIKLMENNIEMPLTLEELADQSNASPRQLQRLFKQWIGRSPTQYYLNIRLCVARDLLQRTTMAISEIVCACGFVCPSHFSRCYRKCFDVSPHEDRTLLSTGVAPDF